MSSFSHYIDTRGLADYSIRYKAKGLKRFSSLLGSLCFKMLSNFLVTCLIDFAVSYVPFSLLFYYLNISFRLTGSSPKESLTP